jgi:DNA polymerase-3 subunit gamma/tau
MKAELDMRNASSPRLSLEMSLIKASFLRGIKPLKEILENIEAYVRSSSPEAKKPASPEPEIILHESHVEVVSASHEIKQTHPEEILKQVQDDTPMVQNDTLCIQADTEVLTEPVTEGFWERAIKKMDAPLSSKLSRAEFKLNKNELKIILNGGDSLFTDSIRKNLKTMERIFSEEIGTEVKVKIETIKEKEKKMSKKELKEKVMGEPIIKEALQLFEGRIVDVTPIQEDKN